MADDLASAARGALPAAGERSLTLTAVPSAPRVVPNAGTPKLVKLPPETRAPREAPRRRQTLVLLALVVSLITVGGIATVRIFRPAPSGTVADVVPAEALAFVGVRGSSTGTEPVLSGLLSAVGGLTPERLAGAADLAYLLLPGPSAAEPIPALLVQSPDPPDLSAFPTLGTRQIAPGVLVIADSAHLGRVAGLSGRRWGHERTFQSLMRQLPTTTPILLAARSAAVTSFLQPFFPHTVSVPSELVMALLPDDDGKTASVLLRTASAGVSPRASSENPVDRAATPAVELTRKVPPSAVLVLERRRAELEAFLASEPRDLPPALRSALQALRTQPDDLRKILEAVADPVLFGVLPSGTTGVRDSVVLLPLRPDSAVQTPLRSLEPALASFGPYLGGGAPADGAFLETTYQDTPLRYVNFGSPARAADYTVVDGNLLILATSRESMRAVLDTVRGKNPSLADTAEFSSLAGIAQGYAWTFVRPDTTLRGEMPAAVAAVNSMLKGLILRPTSSGNWTGGLVFNTP